jgi:non-ribosomal peptide synthetase component E (peptide arylation enzyme)
MEQALMNIRQLLESRVQQHPEKAFLIFEDQVTSYADFDTTVNRVACGFLRLGIRTGDRVCDVVQLLGISLCLVWTDEDWCHAGAD